MQHPFDINRVYLPQWLRLDQSENPYGFSFNRYPNKTHENTLYESYIRYINDDIGRPNHLSTKNMLFTRGAADGIDLILRTLALNHTQKIAVTDPTFFPITHWARHYGLTVVTEKLTGVDLDRFQTHSFIREDIGICFLINPNNPTSTCLSAVDLMDIIDNFNGLVVVDETYIDFCHAQSVIDHVHQKPNLVILRSLSKAWGCAGLRAGFIIAHPNIIQTLQQVQPPFMCDTFSCDYLTLLLNQRYTEYCQYRSLLIQSRDALIASINDLSDFNVLRSQTNFILIHGKELSTLEKHFMAWNIQYKKITLQKTKYIRVSIGTELEMKVFKDIIISEKVYVSAK